MTAQKGLCNAVSPKLPQLEKKFTAVTHNFLTQPSFKHYFHLTYGAANVVK